jgi:hypothetical protein
VGKQRQGEGCGLHLGPDRGEREKIAGGNTAVVRG